jgi:hypothetical protein
VVIFIASGLTAAVWAADLFRFKAVSVSVFSTRRSLGDFDGFAELSGFLTSSALRFYWF